MSLSYRNQSIIASLVIKGLMNAIVRSDATRSWCLRNCKNECVAIGSTFAAFQEPVAWWIMAALHLFSCYIGICWSDLAQLVPLFRSHRQFLCCSVSLSDFSVTIPRYCNNVCTSSFCFGQEFIARRKLWLKSKPFQGFDLIGYSHACNHLSHVFFFILLFRVTYCVAVTE